MSIGKPVGPETRQRIFVFRGGVFTVEPSLIPLFGVTVQLGVRKFNLFSFLNGDATEFSIGSIYKFGARVQMEEIPEQLHSWLFLEVRFTENLKVAYIGYRVGSNILMVELKAGNTSRKNFEPGGLKPRPM